MPKIAFKKLKESQKEIVKKIKKREYREEFNDIIRYVFELLNVDHKSYNRIAKQKYTSVMASRLSLDLDFFDRFIDSALEFNHSDPEDSMSDLALFFVQTIEECRHQLFLLKFVESMVDFEHISSEFKISDHFGTSFGKHLTPDVLMRRHDELYVFELKVRSSINYSGMDSFYKRYKEIVKNEAYVQVVNLNPKTLTISECGDFTNLVIDTLKDCDFSSIESLTDIAGEIRDKYSKFPIFIDLQSSASDMEFDYIDSYEEDDYKSLPYYSEIYSQFTQEMIDDMDLHMGLNYTESDELVMDELLESSKGCLKDYIKKDEHNFFNVMKSEIENDNYPETKLTIKDIGLLIDERNYEIYKPVNSYTPSIYMGISTSHTGMINDRSSYYKEIFGEINSCSNNDPYTQAMKNMITDIFVTCPEIILDSQNFDYKSFEGINEEYIKMREEADKDVQDNRKKINLQIASRETDISRLNIYYNSVFTWNDNYKGRKIITSFEKKDKSDNEKKKFISYKDNEPKVDLLESVMKTINTKDNNKLRLGPIKRALSTHDIHSDNYFVDDFPETLLDKFSEHLYTMHQGFKNMLSMSMISNQKFRVIQTVDPNNIFLMLPNADIKDKGKVRYINFTILKKSDLMCSEQELAMVNNALGLTHSCFTSSTHIILLSKVISLDIGRIKILSNSFVKYLILKSYYNHIKSQTIEFVDNDSVLCFLTSQLVTMSSLSLTESYKNIMMVAYSDYSNLDNLIKDKLTPRPTSIAHVLLLKRMIGGIVSSSDQLSILNKKKKDTFYDENTAEIKGIGFEDIKLKLPLTNYTVHTPKEVLHESYLLFYIGNKGLHGSPQENIKLYDVSVKFEKEYDQYLKENGSTVQEVTGDQLNGFSFEALKFSTLYTFSKLKGSFTRIRENIVRNLALEKSPFVHQQFSSQKSMILSNVVDEVDVPEYLDPKNYKITLNEFGLWLKHCKYNDINEFVTKNNSYINKINEMKSLTKGVSDVYGLDEPLFKKSANRNRLLPELIIMSNKGVKFVIAKSMSFFCPNYYSYYNPSSSKVIEEFYKYSKDNNLRTTKDLLESLKQNKEKVKIRVFNKNQRSYEDREIYTGNITCRLCLFPIETYFKSINQCIDEEAITIPGDMKHRAMHDQRIDLIKHKRFDKMREGCKGNLYAVSSDASKWSARDTIIKFIIPIVYNPLLTKSEKSYLLYCLIRYYEKVIILTDQSYMNCFKFYNENHINDIYKEMTSGFKKNHWIVRSNWLQGNMNNISSFVHCCSANMLECLTENWNDQYKDAITMKYLVHSDDSSYDFSLLLNSNGMRPFGLYFNDPKNQGKLMISMIKYCAKKHSITMNEKKTYISKNYKEFLSTLLVGNEIFYFYIADLLPLCSDTSYKSPLDDLAAYSSFINNAYSHLCPRSIIVPAIRLINYLSLSTYNIDPTNSKNPMKNLRMKGLQICDLPIQIMPVYKIPPSFAGLIPYYCADAVNIVQMVASYLRANCKYDEDLSLEENMTFENLDYCMHLMPIEQKNYIQACCLTQDVSVFNDDNEDPYTGFKMNELCQSSIITLAPIKNQGKIPKYESYNDYMKDKEMIDMEVIANPQWILKKPTDPDECKTMILSNYGLSSYIDSLSFSTPELDFARRIMDSNKSVYRLNLVPEEKRDMNINRIYDVLKRYICETFITADKLQSYLNIYLFSNNQHSAIVQAHFAKVENTLRSKSVNKPYFMTSPKSIFRHSDYGLDSYEIIKQIILNKERVDIEVNHYVQQFIMYAFNFFTSLNTKELKIYDTEDTIDDNFKLYIQSRYKTTSYTDHLVELDQHHLLANEIYRIKVIYRSLLIHNYLNKLLKKKSYLDFNVKGVLLVLDYFIKRSKISSKSVLVTTLTRDITKFWLDRFGMYTYDDQFVHYVLDKTAIFVDDRMKLKRSNASNRVAYRLLISCMTKNFEYDDDLRENPERFGIDLKGFLESTKDSTDLSNNLIHYCYNDNLIDKTDYIKSKLKELRTPYNDWLLRESENDEGNFSVVYQYQNIYMKFRTTGDKDRRELHTTRYYIGSINPRATEQILRTFEKDMKVFFSHNKMIHPSHRNNFGKQVIYKRISSHIISMYNDPRSMVLSYINDCSLNNSTIDVYSVIEKSKYVFKAKYISNEDGSETLEFNYKFSKIDHDDLLIDHVIRMIKKDKNNSFLVKLLFNEGLLRNNSEKNPTLLTILDPQYFCFLFDGPNTYKELEPLINGLKKYNVYYAKECKYEYLSNLFLALEPSNDYIKPKGTFEDLVSNLRQKDFDIVDYIQEKSTNVKPPYSDSIFYIISLEPDFYTAITILIILIIRNERSKIKIDKDLDIF
ncbi:RNA-dependent RNA polymerase [Japanese star anise ringspot-associated virus]|uniref:RNA-directed RNA polymerase L n=1 Tax=Japanese star anise ringspot-associated virus TaxID=2798807 RepID=A0A8J9WH93_9VIRU|nr:RNA-dependent RNA polymerase [Japanese star anise ringspot-associated virus]BCO17108.1 RNA-dependent RNA polymerase [Japanese star anise ringspot-associated virus]